jgi:CHAT domain-containing protein
LVLSLVHPDGRDKDGFLRLHEIYNLNLPVDMVVLGACETALGNEIRGEGVESLARGFMYAGASRLVASLWKVDDESASEFMKTFYRGILGKPNRSPAAALREAQIETMRNPRWSDPSYWAAFVFLGEWQ